MFIPMLITFSPKGGGGGDWLHELLGEARRFLIFPTNILKPTPGLIVGLVFGLSTLSPLRITSLLPSCTPMHLPTSSIHPHLCIGLGKGDRTVKELAT
jgi:hypothetical protein